MQAWYRLGTRVLNSNFGRLSAPYKLTYVVTKECHSRCVNCKIWMTKPQNELTLDEVHRFAKKNAHFSWIDFTGGEPTDRPDFVELVQAFHQYNPDLLLTHFPTNGLKPDRIEEVVRKLRQTVPNEIVITVSIDGPPSINDQLRGIKGDFELATETLKRLRMINDIKVYVGMTLYPQNLHLIDDTIKAIQEKIPDFARREFHINVPHLSSHFYGNEDVANKHSINEQNLQSTEFRQKVIATIKDYKSKNAWTLSAFAWVERIYQSQVTKYLETGITPVDCAALMASCYLSENGTVYPCLIWDSPLGNIRDHDYELQPILHADKAKKHRELIVKKQCPQCWTPCEAYQSLGAQIKKPFSLL